jgi:hypothetical protein
VVAGPEDDVGVHLYGSQSVYEDAKEPPENLEWHGDGWDTLDPLARATYLRFLSEIYGSINLTNSKDINRVVLYLILTSLS